MHSFGQLGVKESGGECRGAAVGVQLVPAQVVVLRLVRVEERLLHLRLELLEQLLVEAGLLRE